MQQRAERRGIDLRNAQFLEPATVQSEAPKRALIAPNSVVVSASGRYTDVKQFLADLHQDDSGLVLEQLTLSAEEASQAVDFRAVLLWGHVSQ